MAFTIPEYVDTQEQAILAVASAVKGEQVTGGDGNVGTALDILADALAGENVTVPMTQQGAILALAQYVGGGGGGATEFWMWNVSEDVGAVTQYVGVSRAVGADFEEESFITEPLTVEQVTTTYEGQTIYGVHVTDVPIGSVIVVDPPQSFVLLGYSLLYALDSFPPYGVGDFREAPAPLEGCVLSGTYMLESTI